jgi:dTMP kinase
VAATGRPIRRGWFITFEGPEGAGKTTQADRLRGTLAAAGRPVELVREPGGTPAGERIRELLLGAADAAGNAVALGPRADALLFNAARAQLVEEVIKPVLAAGTIVISTRFADSTLAYQGFGAGLDLDELRALERFATGGLRPDLTLLLDVPVDLGLRRKAGEETRFESAFDRAFHERVRQGFLTLAADEPDRFTVVDGRLPADAVAAAIAAAVERLIGRGATGPVLPAPGRHPRGVNRSASRCAS